MRDSEITASRPPLWWIEARV